LEWFGGREGGRVVEGSFGRLSGFWGNLWVFDDHWNKKFMGLRISFGHWKEFYSEKLWPLKRILQRIFGHWKVFYS
jgi:hypothetical protein